MKFSTFEVDGKNRLGAEQNGKLVDLAAAHRRRSGASATEFPVDMLALIRAGTPGLRLCQQALEFAATEKDGVGLVFDKAACRLRAPIARPGKILCSGINYHGHFKENPQAKMPSEPFFFSKLPSAVVGPGEPIVVPPLSKEVDYEVELAAVIGKRLHRATEGEVPGALFGFTILHDVSARDVQFKENQITLGKNFDSFSPIGPCIVTPDEFPHPERRRLRTWLNGEVMQDGSTEDWVFSLPRLIAHLSQVMTLEPGDVVTTGTPAGVGYFRNPRVFLKPGDTVVLEIEGIGRLENPVVQ